MQWVPLLKLVRVQEGIRGARLKAPPSHPNLPFNVVRVAVTFH
jgi:hypothetical protein